MLHDGTHARVSGQQVSAERRHSQRVAFPAELVVRWHHEQELSIRYEVIDSSEGGFRIRSSMPMLEGMTGIALKLLPEGTPVNRTVMIVWIGPSTSDGSSEFGLNFIEPV